MRVERILIALLALVLPAAYATATPVAYGLDITLSSCTSHASGDACNGSDPVSVGVTYRGQFTIDHSVLATDGYSDAGFQSFQLGIGSYMWDSLVPSDYHGSRFYNPISNVGGFGAWTLHVQNGELDGICCGVYGIGDTPLVDLYSWTYPGINLPTNFVAMNASSPGEFGFNGFGTFAIHRIPEPNALVLLCFALLSAVVLSSCKRA